MPSLDGPDAGPDVGPADAMPPEPTAADPRKLWRYRDRTVVRLPAYEQVVDDPVLYAHASRVMHAETNPGNARALVQRHGDRDLWLNPPPIPLSTPEMDAVFDLPYARRPHSSYGQATHSGLGDDPHLGEHHARLFRRLHILLHHRARGPHHPEPLREVGAARDRGHPRQDRRLHRGHLRPGRAHGQHVPAGLQVARDRGGLPAAVVRVPGQSARTWTPTTRR